MHLLLLSKDDSGENLLHQSSKMSNLVIIIQSLGRKNAKNSLFLKFKITPTQDFAQLIFTQLCIKYLKSCQNFKKFKINKRKIKTGIFEKIKSKIIFQYFETGVQQT